MSDVHACYIDFPYPYPTHTFPYPYPTHTAPYWPWPGYIGVPYTPQPVPAPCRCQPSVCPCCGGQRPAPTTHRTSGYLTTGGTRLDYVVTSASSGTVTIDGQLTGGGH